MTEPNSSGPSLGDQKLQQEIERLRVETGQLRTPAWKTPATLLAVGGLVVSAIANVQQYVSASRAESRAGAEAAAAQERWATERTKLEAEIDELRRKTSVSVEDRARIQAELAKVQRDIDVWEEAIFKDTVQLQLENNTLAQYEADKRPEMAEAQRRTVEMMKATLAMRVAERDKLVTRRAELERQLSGQ